MVIPPEVQEEINRFISRAKAAMHIPPDVEVTATPEQMERGVFTVKVKVPMDFIVQHFTLEEEK